MSLGLMAHTQNITVFVIFTIFRHTLLRLQQAYKNSRQPVSGRNWKVSLGNLPQSPIWDRLGEVEAPLRVLSMKGRSQAIFVLVLLPWVLRSAGALLALLGLESRTQAPSSLSTSQQCNALGTKFCRGRDLADVAFF